MSRYTEKLPDGRSVIKKEYSFATNSVYGSFIEGKAVDKLAAYEDAYERGLLIRLHCKIGDTVYFIKAFYTIAKFPIEAKVTSICGLDCYNNVIYSAITKDGCRIRKFESSDIGTTVFFTKEQAEEALKNMKISQTDL